MGQQSRMKPVGCTKIDLFFWRSRKKKAVFLTRDRASWFSSLFGVCGSFHSIQRTTNNDILFIVHTHRTRNFVGDGYYGWTVFSKLVWFFHKSDIRHTYIVGYEEKMKLMLWWVLFFFHNHIFYPKWKMFDKNIRRGRSSSIWFSLILLPI